MKTSGLGGHYNSVRDLRAAFMRDWPDVKVSVLTIGNVQPAAFDSADPCVHHISTEGRGMMALIRDVTDLGDRLAPTHVHAFDNKSYAFARRIAARRSAKKFITRPGGPNPRYFPWAPDIVCFSAENRDSLSKNRRYRDARFHLIPQRVGEPEWDRERIRSLRAMTDGQPILLRIARITELNRPSLWQTVRLSEFLRDQGVDHTLMIIGTPNDSDLVRQLQERVSGVGHIVTNLHFTRNADRLTAVANAVVGSGRTLIEAAMADAVLFSPISDSELPALVTRGNWRTLAHSNFSYRSVLPAEDVPSREQMVQGFSGHSDSPARIIASEFRIDNGVTDRYRELYSTPQHERAHPLDHLANWVSFIAPYLRLRLASRSRS